MSLTSLGSNSALAYGHILAQVLKVQIIKAAWDSLGELMCRVCQLHLVLHTLYQTENFILSRDFFAICAVMICLQVGSQSNGSHWKPWYPTVFL